MNDTTLLVLRLLGPLYLVVGLGFLLNKKHYEDMYQKIKGEPFMLFMTGLMAMAVGLSIIYSHNLWTTPSEVIVSIVGWGAAIKGAWITICPKSMLKISDKLMKKGIINFSGILVLIIGAIVSYLGFFS